MQIGSLTAFLQYLLQILMAVMMGVFMVMMIPRAIVARWVRREWPQVEVSFPVPAPAPVEAVPERAMVVRETDDTEGYRRAMLASGQPQADLAADKDQKWGPADLARDFEVLGFMAPFVVVRRLSDGVKGSLEFTHHPRVYFGWRADA